MGVLNDYTNAAAVNAALNKGVEANKAVSELKEDLSNIENHLEKSKNIYDASKSVSGYLGGGNVKPSDSYVTSDYIPVEIGEKYLFSNDSVPIQARCIALYKLQSNGTYGFLKQEQYVVGEYTITQNMTTHIRVTFSVDYNKVQIDAKERTPYVPYGEYKFINDTKSELEVIKEVNERHPANNGNLPPTSFRTGYIVYYKSNISTFESFIISRGNTSKEFLSVGNTQIVYKSGDGATSTVSHNLNWKDKCDVIIDSVDLAHTNVTLITNGGLFTYTFDRTKGYGNEGVWETTGTGELTCQIRKPNDIWVLGDSYMSYADNRIGGALVEIGQTTPTILSVPGANTVYMASEFEKTINCFNVIPKTLVVCTGMNDDETSYKQGLSSIKDLCDKYNINLILTAIPITPLRNTQNLSVRNYVLTLDCPIIRFDYAVGSNDSGIWLDNCLDTDNIHPTQNGARLLAHELLNKVGYLC